MRQGVVPFEWRYMRNNDCLMAGFEFTWIHRGQMTVDHLPLLKLSSLSVKVGIRRVIENLSFTLMPGDYVVVSGPNGCGKSSLFNAILGMDPVKVDDGKIEFNGMNITRFPTHKIAALGIGYLLQRNNVFPALSVEDNLRLSLGNTGPELFKKEYPEWNKDIPLNRRAGLLSGGQKKKVAIAMIALKKCKLFLLDEPEAGLDGVVDTESIRNSAMSVIHIKH